MIYDIVVSTANWLAPVGLMCFRPFRKICTFFLTPLARILGYYHVTLLPFVYTIAFCEFSSKNATPSARRPTSCGVTGDELPQVRRVRSQKAWVERIALTIFTHSCHPIMTAVSPSWASIDSLPNIMMTIARNHDPSWSGVESCVAFLSEGMIIVMGAPFRVIIANGPRPRYPYTANKL